MTVVIPGLEREKATKSERRLRDRPHNLRSRGYIAADGLRSEQEDTINSNEAANKNEHLGCAARPKGVGITHVNAPLQSWFSPAFFFFFFSTSLFSYPREKKEE